MTTPLPEQIELHHDRMWRRDEDHRVESAVDAEHFIEDVGFLNKRSEIRSQRSVFGASVFGRLSPRSIQKRQKDEGNQRSDVSSCAGKPAARRSSKAGVRCKM
jgi:site-specific recombinase XerC